jgi:hypothetical protein
MFQLIPESQKRGFPKSYHRTSTITEIWTEGNGSKRKRKGQESGKPSWRRRHLNRRRGDPEAQQPT